MEYEFAPYTHRQLWQKFRPLSDTYQRGGATRTIRPPDPATLPEAHKLYSWLSDHAEVVGVIACFYHNTTFSFHSLTARIRSGWVNSRQLSNCWRRVAYSKGLLDSRKFNECNHLVVEQADLWQKEMLRTVNIREHWRIERVRQQNRPSSMEIADLHQLLDDANIPDHFDNTPISDWFSPLYASSTQNPPDHLFESAPHQRRPEPRPSFVPPPQRRVEDTTNIMPPRLPVSNEPPPQNVSKEDLLDEMKKAKQDLQGE